MDMRWTAAEVEIARMWPSGEKAIPCTAANAHVISIPTANESGSRNRVHNWKLMSTGPIMSLILK